MVAIFGSQIEAGGYKEVKEWAKKIGKHHFMTGCWGEQSTMKYYKAIEEYTEQCMQLAPAFEIELFETEDAGDNFIDDSDDEMVDPFISTSQGFESLPAQLVQAGGQVPRNPLEAWMTFWAQNYGKGQKSPFQRSKRDAPVDPPSREDLMKFSEALGEFKEMKTGHIANLTCVMRKMKYLNSNLGVNVRHFTSDEMWDDLVETPEPAFKNKMIEGYKMCYEYSENIPMDVLEKKGPYFKQFGRQMMFFKCAKKMGMAVCVKKELLKWIEYLYGKPNASLRAKLGLPKDEYDSAFLTFMVKDKMQNPESKFINEFFFH